MPQDLVVDDPAYGIGQPGAGPVVDERPGGFVEHTVERWEVRDDDGETLRSGPRGQRG